MSSTTEPRLPPRWFIRVAWAVHRALYSIPAADWGFESRPPPSGG